MHATLEPLAKGTKAPVGDAGTSKLPYVFHASQMKPTTLEGGTVKIVDSTNFNVSTTIAMAEVTIEPGAIRCVSFCDQSDCGGWD